MKEAKRKNRNQETKRGRKRQAGVERKVSKRKTCFVNDQALLLPPKNVRPLGIMGLVVLRGIQLEDGGSNPCANSEAASTAHASQS